ncbi:MAG: winged helix DNA-binding domain-containing protein [Thermoactinospora sp.]|nr:winged helix DNA-binding domain-containing protein [Thermoactinospora sp.]
MRALNRTYLHRQLLLERHSMPALEAVRHLIALQAQEPNWPYLGLWTRLRDFRLDELTELMDGRQAMRTTLIRTTQHLVATDDLRWLRPTVQRVLGRTSLSPYFTGALQGIDVDELVDAARELLDGEVMTRKELGALLSERYPGRDERLLAATAELILPMYHPCCTWGRWGTRPGQTVALVGEMRAPDVRRMVERYLAAYGPATVMDVQAWSGLTKLREVMDEMPLKRSGVLYDLPDMPEISPDVPAPVRFLPAFDNLVLAHKDRTRIISDADRKRVIHGAGMVRPTFLVDGFVHGMWAIKGQVLRVLPFRPVPDEDEVYGEATRLAAFLGLAKVELT